MVLRMVDIETITERQVNDPLQVSIIEKDAGVVARPEA